MDQGALQHVAAGQPQRAAQHTERAERRQVRDGGRGDVLQNPAVVRQRGLDGPRREVLRRDTQPQQVPVIEPAEVPTMMSTVRASKPKSCSSTASTPE